MKIIDNSKKHNLPPRYALYDAPANALYLYASLRGFEVGLKAAWRRGRYTGEIATFYRGYGDVDWGVYKATLIFYSGSVSLTHIVREIVHYEAGRASESFFADTTAEDTTAEDTTAEDTTAEDTTAEDITAYRRRVSCAGSPATVSACVVFSVGGCDYVRGYQSLTRAVQGYYHYIDKGASRAALLVRPHGDWDIKCLTFDSSKPPQDYLVSGSLVNCAIWLASKHFGKGV